MYSIVTETPLLSQSIIKQRERLDSSPLLPQLPETKCNPACYPTRIISSLISHLITLSSNIIRFAIYLSNILRVYSPGSVGSPEGSLIYRTTCTWSEKLRQQAYSDADWAADVTDGRSTTGHCIRWENENGLWFNGKARSSLLLWTCEVYMALNSGMLCYYTLYLLDKDIKISREEVWCSNNNLNS